jgi:predicted metalloendopeptidase
MSAEYSAFAVPNVTYADGTPMHVNGKLTLGENIADNGGLKTAFRASNVANSQAPTVAGFTPVQQFFLGFAQLWCGKDSSAYAKKLLLSDAHSPNKARVNVTLSNFSAFSDAFQCKAGSTMVPANRCEVW